MGLNFEGARLAGRYEIQAHLASGGMSVVYRGWDHCLCRPVAIKVLRDADQQDVTHIARFRREARTAALLCSPFIVQSYDFLKEQDSYFLVMELVEGLHLKNYILARGRLAAEDALLIAEQVCLALVEAHGHGFLHRDIKPQNILLDESGNAKLADFGIVHVAAARGLTTEGIVLGTADYISPEQAQGLELGPTTDMYSLGVVLFEMLSGVLPFNGTTSLVVAMQHATMPPPPLRSIAPEISRDVESLVHRALAKKPEYRFRSAREMSLALRSAREALLPHPAELQQPYSRVVEEALSAMDWRGLAERLCESAELAKPIYEVVGRRGSRGSTRNHPIDSEMPAGVDSAAVLAGRHRSQEASIVPILLLACMLMILLLCIVFLHSLG